MDSLSRGVLLTIFSAAVLETGLSRGSADDSRPRILLLDCLDKTTTKGSQLKTVAAWSAGRADAPAGTTTGKCEVATTRLGKGILCCPGNADSNSIVYATAGNIDPGQGTIEVWLRPTFNVADIREHHYVARVDFDKSNALAMYVNRETKALVFWVRDTDDPASRKQTDDYRVILATPRLNWKKGELHHVAVTWCGESQRVYVDGVKMGRLFFDGKIRIKPGVKGRIALGRSSGFVYDAVRIWDRPRYPRRLRVAPTISDHAPPHYPGQSPAIPETALRVAGEDLEMALEPKSRTPIGLTTTKGPRQWLWRPMEVWIENRRPAGPKPGWDWSWSAKDGRILGELTIHGRGSGRPSLVDVTLVAPLLWPGMKAFVPADDCPFDVSVGRPSYDYQAGVESGVGVNVPLVCVYDPKRDEGVSIVFSPDSVKTALHDFGMEGRPTDLRIALGSVEVPAGGRQLIRWHFAGCAGDWRDGLRVCTEIFPDVLTPSGGPILKADQGMVIGGPSTTEFLTSLRRLGVGWREVSLHLGKGAEFGNFIPDDLAPYQASIKGYRQNIRSMHEHGMLAMMYIQARECFDVERALKEFGQCVVRDKDGKPLVNRYGPFGASMTARPGSPWFNHIVDQARRILDTFPDADGLFFDNAWSLEYGAVMHEVAKVARSRGKSLTSNGANAISVGSSDAIMAESAWYVLGDIQYLGLVKPIVYAPIYSYASSPKAKERLLRAPGLIENLSRDLKACLASGAFYGFNYRGVKYWPEESLELMDRYVVLQRLLHGREWVLTPHALTLPERTRGNVFELPDGRWAVTLVCPNSDLASSAKNCTISFRVRPAEDAGSVTKVELLDIRAPHKARPVERRIQGGELVVSLSKFSGVGMVLIACHPPGGRR